jgi:hypothetical protein
MGPAKQVIWNVELVPNTPVTNTYIPTSWHYVLSDSPRQKLNRTTVLFLKPLSANALQKLLNCFLFFSHTEQNKQISEFVNVQIADFLSCAKHFDKLNMLGLIKGFNR